MNALFATFALAAALQPSPTPAIREAVAATGTPGLVAVVVDRKGIVYAEAFGMRDRDRKLPATLATRFYIASATKSFTALTALLLAKEGKLDIDAPLDKSMPQLKLPSPLDPARLSLRDLMTHRLGFENDPVVFRTAYTGNWDDPWIWSALARFSKPKAREFSYDNLGYVILGYAIASAGGAPWQEAIARRVLEPAGMRATGARVPPAAAQVAVPYTVSSAGWVRVDAKTDRQMHAAGGMYSTANDLARWVRLQLGEGTLDGAEVFPRRIVRETQAAQIHLQRRLQRYDRFAYGLGWYLADLDGDLLLHHFGGYAGSQAHVSFMPERGIGVVVLTNTDNPLAHVVASYLYDRLRGRADAGAKLSEEVKRLQTSIDRVPDREKERLEKAVAQLAPAVLAAARNLTSLAGDWTSDEYGTLTIDAAGAAHIGDLRGKIERYRGSALVFRNNGDADLIWIRDDGALIWHDVVFRRKP